MSQTTVENSGAGTPARRSDVVALAFLDVMPEWERLAEMLAPGHPDTAAFRHRMVDAPLGLDVSGHSTRPRESWSLNRLSLSGPVHQRTVLETASTPGGATADLRPGWGVTVVDGLTGGQAALIVHVVRPGNDDPSTDDTLWSRFHELPRTAAELLRSTVNFTTETATGLVKALFEPPARRPETPAATASGSDPVHRLHTLEIPLDRIHSAASYAGCTPDSAVAATVLLGYEAYRQRRGSGRSGVTADPLDTMRRIDSAGIDDPPDDDTPRAFVHDDVLTCSVPGSPTPLSVAGAGIDRYFAFGRTEGSAFNATVLPYLDHYCVGLSVDPEAVPDRAAFDECLRLGVRAVLEA